MRKLIEGIAAAGLVFFAAACGGSTDAATECGTSPGCGGNIVGTWAVTSSCVTFVQDTMSQSCPDEKVSAVGLSLSGTITYGADNTYTSDFTTSGDITFTLPGSCLMQQGIKVTCDQLSQSLASNPSTGISGSCTGASDGSCTCHEVLDIRKSGEHGTYATTASGTLTQIHSSGKSDTTSYCVKGSTLTVSPSSASPTTGTITLTRQ